MPMKMMPVSDIAGDVSIDANFVIDTGADLTVLKNDLAVQLNLYDAPAGMSYVSGVGAEPIQRQLYGALVSLANQKIMIAVDCRDDFNENLMGRDVINEFALTLCAKRKIVQFEWIPDEMRHE